MIALLYDTETTKPLLNRHSGLDPESPMHEGFPFA